MTKTVYCKHCASQKIHHEFQDKTYGEYQRLFNVSDDGKKMTCTICGNKIDVK